MVRHLPIPKNPSQRIWKIQCSKISSLHKEFSEAGKAFHINFAENILMKFIFDFVLERQLKFSLKKKKINFLIKI